MNVNEVSRLVPNYLLSGSLDGLICVLMVVHLFRRLPCGRRVAKHHVNRPLAVNVVVHQRRCNVKAPIIFVLIIVIIGFVVTRDVVVLVRITWKINVMVNVFRMTVAGIHVEVYVERH